jgi:hypothetical protein
MDRAGQEAEDHPVRMMDSPPRQIETAPEGDFLKRVFDDFDHLGHRKNLINGRVLNKEHSVARRRRSDNQVRRRKLWYPSKLYRTALKASTARGLSFQEAVAKKDP